MSIFSKLSITTGIAIKAIAVEALLKIYSTNPMNTNDKNNINTIKAFFVSKSDNFLLISMAPFIVITHFQNWHNH